MHKTNLRPRVHSEYARLARSTVFGATFLAILFVGGCTTQAEVDVPLPPEILPQRAVNLVERKIAGQVFWTTQGRETIRLSGAQILVYDAARLASARDTILRYEREQFDAISQTYPGRPSTMMRARIKIRDRVDLSWASLGNPIAAALTDADGRFELQAKLPEKIGIYCEADRKIFDENERHRWAVTEQEAIEPGRIILSNVNMLHR